MSTKRLEKIEKKLDRNGDRIKSVESLVEKNSNAIKRVEGLVAKNSNSIKRVEGLVTKNSDSIQEIQGVVKGNSKMIARNFGEIQDIRENMVTKDMLNEHTDRIIGVMDGIVGNQKRFDSELAANCARSDRLEGRVEVLEERASC